MNPPRPIVVDASIAIAILLGEPGGSDAEAVITRQTRAGGRVVVPSHFWLEATNPLITRRGWSGADVLHAIHTLDALHFETIDFDRALLVLTLDGSERYRLTMYDAAYLAIANSIDGSLMTLDTALHAAAGPRVVPIGPARLSETPALYEHAVTWPDYKGASAFLAKLRAEAARSA
jgi:predicted nucleic acid-binding protein